MNHSPNIFLSWDGETFGPDTLASVHEGIRLNEFPEDATFWLEGQTDWRPLAEFSELFPDIEEDEDDNNDSQEQNRPELIVRRHRGKHSGSSRHKPRQSKRHRKMNLFGVLVVILITMVAIAAMVGILLLLMRF